MRTGKAIISLLFFILIPLSAALAGEAMITITRAHQGQEIKVPAGALFRLVLEEPGATGYTWEIIDLDQEYLEVLRVDTTGPREPGFTGGPITKTFELQAKKKGAATLKLARYRPWEGKDKAVDRCHFNILIF